MTVSPPVPAEAGADWWRSAVVYQVYPRSFSDSDGDGVGDLAGVTSRLDYLESLGVDVVWLSPIYRSPQDDNGYDISDYENIDPTFGTNEALDDLIEGLHNRGMKLVMDLVVNHSSDEHPWFLDARSTIDSPKRDWYWWRPPREGFVGGQPGAEPTNWRSFFSGSAWTWDEATGEYYLHLFSRKQPDLNWENTGLRQAVYAMMRRWVARGVDGFRLDVINLISKAHSVDGSMPDAALEPDGTSAVSNRQLGDGSAFYTNGPRLHEFLAEMNREVLAHGGANGQALVSVGEMPGVTLDVARAVTNPARSELDMVFTFEHLRLDRGTRGKWDPHPTHLPDLKKNLALWQTGLEAAGWNSLYWNNHDQPRVVSRFGDDSAEHRVASAKTLATVLHMLRGTPYIYQGEELGMTNAGWSDIEDYRDIETLNHYREELAAGATHADVMSDIGTVSRDNARTPMQWDATTNAGFTTGIPWLAANLNYPSVNVALATADPGSVFHHYRRLIELRHTLPVVVDGHFTLLLPDHEQVFAYVRELPGPPVGSPAGARRADSATSGSPPHGAQTLLVVANMSSEPMEVLLEGLESILKGDPILSTHTTTTPDGDWVHLAPWESRIHLGSK